MRGQVAPAGDSDIGPLHMQTPSIHTLEPHSGSVPIGEWLHTRMGSGGSSTIEYELCLQARADQWSHLFWTTIRDLKDTLSSDPQIGAPLPLKSISVPISEFRIQTQEELDLVCSAIRLELKRFSREHRLTQGILVTYSPLTMSGDRIRAEM